MRWTTYDSIIFDLDGTLWDASESTALAWAKVSKDFKLNKLINKNTIRSVSGLPFNKCVETIFGIETANNRDLKDILDIAEKNEILSQGGELYPDVLEGVSRLSKEYKLFIVSNCQVWYLEAFLTHSKLSAYFEETICFGHTNRSKTENIQELIKKHQLENPLYIGDTHWDQEAAHLAGCRFLFAKYGFGSVNLTCPSVNSFSEVPHLFINAAENYKTDFRHIEDKLCYLNLNSKFNEDLRDLPISKEDTATAVEILQKEMAVELELSLKIKILGLLGTYQRQLGRLDQSQSCFLQAITLCEDIPQWNKNKTINLIRLGNTKHWMGQFQEAHAIFDRCVEQIHNDLELSEYLDFVFQHKAKCYFDENLFELALKYFYHSFLLRLKKNNIELIDSTLLAIETTKKRWLPQLKTSDLESLFEKKEMPLFVKTVFGKKHSAESYKSRANCINAVCNFFAKDGIFQFEPYKPMDLLNLLMQRCIQLQPDNTFQFGDIVVWWNRTGGSWDQRKILVSEINLKDADFPYGLVFDHVAVMVDKNIVFHKPNPSPASTYGFDYLANASYPAKLGKGFEITRHRLIGK
jgi:phosphoglycolate phosphatase